MQSARARVLCAENRIKVRCSLANILRRCEANTRDASRNVYECANSYNILPLAAHTVIITAIPKRALAFATSSTIRYSRMNVSNYRARRLNELLKRPRSLPGALSAGSLSLFLYIPLPLFYISPLPPQTSIRPPAIFFSLGRPSRASSCILTTL